jgi:hypothetical protein
VAAAHSTAGPVRIGYELTPLATPSRFEYRYTVINVSFATPVRWFSVDFDPALYAETSLAITSFGLSDWTQQILASVPGLPAQYDAHKGTGGALGIGDSAGTFSVQFTWLGTGTPGSQAYTIWDPATLDVIATGTTEIVTDTTPPTIAGVSANPSSLWPPNHKMVAVKVSVSASDAGSAVTCKIASVSSNEPVDGLGDGDTAPDWQITGNLTVDLRAERSGNGRGRIYTIVVECVDAAQNRSTKPVNVTVPHDRGN